MRGVADGYVRSGEGGGAPSGAGGGARRRARRFAALGVALSLTVLAGVASGPAEAAKYSVAQCGWGTGRDADWKETAGQRFGQMSPCVNGAADDWSGVRMRTFTRADAVSAGAGKYGRWRWSAPSDTSITKVQGAWWHELHSGFQHRLGGTTSVGSFQRTHTAKSSSGMRTFTAGFGTGVKTFESRLLCARLAGKRCDTGPISHASVRALTITLNDFLSPRVSVTGSVLGGGWLRGNKTLSFSATDRGSGLRSGETEVDGDRVKTSSHSCHTIKVGSEVRGTKMRPCSTSAGGSYTVRTGSLSDGKHTIEHCAFDFSDKKGCSGSRSFKVDNNAPASPRGLTAGEGPEWTSEAGFDLTWKNPGQGSGSPIAGASYRLRGPDGHDSGTKSVDGSRVRKASGLEAPRPGEYEAEVWLRDEAGNSKRSSAAKATYRFDAVEPTVEFHPLEKEGLPKKVRARGFDEHSGLDSAVIRYRPAGARGWTDLPTRLEDEDEGGGPAGEAEAIAAFPAGSVPRGRYEFRVRVTDRAGNRAETSRQTDGTLLTASSPPRPVKPAAPAKASTRLIARLSAGGREGRILAVGPAERPQLSGRLAGGDGAELAGRKLHLQVDPMGGSRDGESKRTITTAEDGSFQVDLKAAASRRIELRFPGTRRLAASRAPDLDLRVRGEVAMRPARPAVVTGRRLLLRGKVSPRAAWIPSRGKLVAIQYLETRARKWRPVMFTRTDRSGRFRAFYRFRYISRPSRVRFRAVAMPEARWPYTAAASRPVAVRVVPRGYRAKRIRARRARARRARSRAARGSRPGRRPGAARRGLGRSLPFGPSRLSARDGSRSPG